MTRSEGIKAENRQEDFAERAAYALHTSESCDIDFKLCEMDPLCFRVWEGRRVTNGGESGRKVEAWGDGSVVAFNMAALTSLS